MPLPFVQDEPSEESYVGLTDRLPVGLGEQVSTTFKNELFNGGITSKVIDLYKKNELEKQDGPVLSKEELQNRYKGLNVNWDGPQKEKVAEYIADRQRQKQYNEAKIEAGPDGYISHGLRIGAGVAAHLADPTELALTVGTAGLFRGAIALRYGAAAIEGAGLATRLGVGAVEGAITQAALEPLQYKYDSEFHNDYKAVDALQRVGFGMAMGSVMEGGIYAGSRLLKRFRGSKAGMAAQDIAMAQIESGRAVNIDPVVTSVERELKVADGSPAPGVRDYSGRLNYEHAPFDPQNPGGQKLYLGSPSALEDVRMVPKDLYGSGGIVGDPRIAHSDASSAWNDALGRVHEMTLSKDAKIASASATLTPPERQMIMGKVSELAKSAPEFAALEKAVKDGEFSFTNLGDMLNEIRANGGDENKLIDALRPTLEEMGFHGMHMEVTEGGARYNRFEIFDNAMQSGVNNRGEALFEKSAALMPDERLNPEFTSAEKAEAYQKAMQPDHVNTPEQSAAFDQIELEHPATPEAFDARLKEMDQEAADGLQLLAEQAKDDPELAKVLEQAQELDAVFKQELATSERAMKAAMNCVVKNGL